MDKVKNNLGLTESEFLNQYDASKFERPSVTVDMVIFTIAEKDKENYRKLTEKTLKVLMIKRGEHPYLGKWALPGGFVDMNESLDEAAQRELKSETNVGQVYLEQLYTWGEVDRDPRTRVISSSYMALIDSRTQDIKAGEDASEASWFELRHRLIEEKKTILETGCIQEKTIEIILENESETLTSTIKITSTMADRKKSIKREVLTSQGIAFDHSKMIEYAVERLRNKVEYTDIAFNLMPELFTLTELQQVYEIILGKELLAAAFRRKIADLVHETNQYTKDAGHRPSKLYKYKAQ